MLRASMATGTAYIAAGSNGRPLLRVEDPVTLDRMDDARDALLISRARVCDAVARFSSVSSLGDEGCVEGG